MQRDEIDRYEIDRYEVGPFEIVAYTTPDEMTSFEEWQVREYYAERESTFDILWWFVGIEVEARFPIGGGENILLGCASVWGIESDDQRYISDEAIPLLAEEAIIEAKTHLRKIEESLKAIHLDNFA